MNETEMQNKIDELVREHNKLARWVHCMSGAILLLYMSISFVFLAFAAFWTKVQGN